MTHNHDCDHVARCYRCDGRGEIAIAWGSFSGWPSDYAKCLECPSCYDCGSPAPEWEDVQREGQPQIVCVECAVVSGDDHLNEHTARCACLGGAL
jgi:hypothetical protein